MPWTAPPVAELDEQFVAPEKQMLDSWLGVLRTSFLMRCTGLTPEQLSQRAVPPSTLSLLGLVRHVTDMERIWFRMRFSGEKISLRFPRRNTCFLDAAPQTAQADYEALLQEWATVDAILAGADLNATFEHHGPMSLRWLYQHVLREYAGHTGHADLLREQIDGTTFS